MIVSAKRRRRRGGLGLVSVMQAGGLTYGSPPVSQIAAVKPIVIARPPSGIFINHDTPIQNPIEVGGSYGFTPSTTWGSKPPVAYGRGSGSSYGYSGGSQYGGTSQYSSNNPTAQNNLAQLTLLYQSNPSSLTAPQWSQLQAAGVIPSTVPYSNASLVNPSGSASTAIDPATGVSYASELAAAQAATATTTAAASTSSVIGTDPTNGATTIFGVDWYYVAGLGAVLLYVMSGKRR